jgi:hypothetical protein
MTEEYKLSLLSKLKNTENEKLSVDTILPQKIESSLETITEVARDEYNLTYDELIEDFHKFEKRAIMKPQTFDRLWS